MKLHRLHLVGVGGSNKVMAGELSRLARRAFDRERSESFAQTPPKKDGPGGLLYPSEPDLAALAVTYHRTSARVLWDLYETGARRLEPLYEELLKDVAADDRGVLWTGARISVLAFDATSVDAGERQVVGTVKNALIEGAARRGIRLHVDPQKPDLTFHARSSGDSLVVSLDLAGRPMHQRGYRLESGAAPIREDLAALLVMLCRHDPRREAFIDPMAGSGTLLVEAAGLARARPLWMSGRRPAAEHVPALKGSIELRPKPLFADTKAALFACESDDATYSVLRRTLQTAGIEPETFARHTDFRNVAPEALRREAEEAGFPSGLILSNPPYGARLGMPDRELMALYRDLGRWCQKLVGYRAGFIVAHPGFRQAFGMRPRIEKPLMNGPLKAMFLLYDL